MNVVEVRAERPYTVHIGHGVLDQLPRLVGTADRVVLVHSPRLAPIAEAVRARLGERVVVAVVVPDGEDAKSPEVLVDAWRQLAQAGVTRSDVVVGVGGGATTDLAGFIAASFLRGIGYVSVPTTVLAMIDAAVGGKTGIDLPEGKNLVGAFHEPLAVIADLDTLDTLSDRDVSSGLSETVKAGFIRDARILELIRQDPTDARDVRSARLAELITRGIAFKAQVVSADLRESTSVSERIGRELLNYGHTMGHAIESHEHFRLRHGEAVALGMVYAALLAQQVLGLSDEDVETHISSLRMLGLPVSYADAPFAALRELMARDKKTRGGTLRFVGLRALGEPEMIVGPDESVLADCYRRLGRI